LNSWMARTPPQNLLGRRSWQCRAVRSYGAYWGLTVRQLSRAVTNTLGAAGSLDSDGRLRQCVLAVN
jgi:hypothetical protein